MRPGRLLAALLAALTVIAIGYFYLVILPQLEVMM